MKKPKKLFISGCHTRVISADGRFNICSTRSNAELAREGNKIKKTRKYMFEVFAGINDEKPYAICSDTEDLTASKAKAAAKWWAEVAIWLEARGNK